jgi:hypothetical protein
MSELDYSTKLDPLQEHTVLTEEHLKIAFEETANKYIEWRKRLLRSSPNSTIHVPELSEFQQYKVGQTEFNIIGINFMLEKIEEIKKTVKYLEQSILSPSQAETLIDRLNKSGISMESLDIKINSTIQ